jgi:hypothetical protein
MKVDDDFNSKAFRELFDELYSKLLREEKPTTKIIFSYAWDEDKYDVV